MDIINFGSPCQDISIAGKRAGLNGSRSNLFYEAIRIIKEMREKTNGTKLRKYGIYRSSFWTGNQNTESDYDSRGILFM